MAKNLTEEKFEEWKSNEFEHVAADCSKIKGKIARMEGIMWVLVPLIIGILSGLVHLIRNGL